MTDEEWRAIEEFMTRSRRRRIKAFLDSKISTARRRRHKCVLVPIEMLEWLVDR